MSVKANTVERGGYRERGPRVRVRVDAVLTESDGCEIPVVILDVSRSGFRLESRAELVPGEDVWLRSARRAPLRARIQWTRGNEAGGIFLEGIAL